MYFCKLIYLNFVLNFVLDQVVDNELIYMCMLLGVILSVPLRFADKLNWKGITAEVVVDCALTKVILMVFSLISVVVVLTRGQNAPPCSHMVDIEMGNALPVLMVIALSFLLSIPIETSDSEQKTKINEQKTKINEPKSQTSMYAAHAVRMVVTLTVAVVAVFTYHKQEPDPAECVPGPVSRQGMLCSFQSIRGSRVYTPTRENFTVEVLSVFFAFALFYHITRARLLLQGVFAELKVHTLNIHLVRTVHLHRVCVVCSVWTMKT
jgi:hypothetical protein